MFFPGIYPSFEVKTASCYLESSLVSSVTWSSQIKSEVIYLFDIPLFNSIKEIPLSTVLKTPPFSVLSKNVPSAKDLGDIAMNVMAALFGI